LKRTDRFHNALELLGNAQQDCSHQEDQADTRALQERAIHNHIEEARNDVHHVIETDLRAS
jgi:hypothetical protein